MFKPAGGYWDQLRLFYWCSSLIARDTCICTTLSVCQYTAVRSAEHVSRQKEGFCWGYSRLFNWKHNERFLLICFHLHCFYTANDHNSKCASLAKWGDASSFRLVEDRFYFTWTILHAKLGPFEALLKNMITKKKCCRHHFDVLVFDNAMRRRKGDVHLLVGHFIYIFFLDTLINLIWIHCKACKCFHWVARRTPLFFLLDIFLFCFAGSASRLACPWFVVIFPEVAVEIELKLKKKVGIVA